MRREEFGIGTLFEKVRDAVIVAEAGSGRVVLWNPAASRVFGYSASEAHGMLVEALVPEYLKDRHRAGIVRYGQTGRGVFVESEEYLDLPAVRKDGEEIRVELSLNPMDLKDREGENGRYVLAVVRDATRRKRAEEDLRRHAAEVADLYNNAPCGYHSLDEEGTIIAINDTELAWLGYAREEVVGCKKFTDLLTERSLRTFRENYPRFKEQGWIDGLEFELVRKDGGRMWVLLSATAIRDAEGNFVASRSTFVDVTDRKRAEEALRRLNEELEERVAERTARLAERESQLKALVGKLVVAQEEERRSVAYEIHDGLTQVAIAAHQHLQVFADDHPPGSRVEPGELDRPLSLAQRVVREARHVIEGLRPTALDDFGLAAALRLMVEELREEGWRVAYEENLGAQRLGPETETGLYRVAQEALNNARKHAGIRQASLKLTLGERELRLEIEDRGRGFDPQAPRRREGPGEQVGLAGMRERIALLGGELTVVSGIGEGTSVVAEVPLEATTEGSRKD
jgi:PAS domain S-box-containing protein